MITARNVFFAAIALTLIVGSVSFWCLDPASPSNREFKRSRTQAGVETNLAKWGPHGIAIAKRNLALDWLFIVIYSTMWISGALYFVQRDPALRLPAFIVAAIGIAGALCDVVENICLYLMLHGNTAERAPEVCNRVAPINFWLFAITGIGFIVIAIVVSLRR